MAPSANLDPAVQWAGISRLCRLETDPPAALGNGRRQDSLVSDHRFLQAQKPTEAAHSLGWPLVYGIVAGGPDDALAPIEPWRHRLIWTQQCNGPAYHGFAIRQPSVQIGNRVCACCRRPNSFRSSRRASRASRASHPRWLQAVLSQWRARAGREVPPRRSR